MSALPFLAYWALSVYLMVGFHLSYHTPSFPASIISWFVIISWLHLTTVRVPLSKYTILKVKQGRSPYGGLGLNMEVGNRVKELRSFVFFGAFWIAGVLLRRPWTLVLIWIGLDMLKDMGLFSWAWKNVYRRYRRLRKRILYPNLK